MGLQARTLTQLHLQPQNWPKPNVGKLLTDTVKGTVGQIPKLDRGAQFVALGVILILVAAGVGMFAYAVHPVG
jgi:hypothetical protein